MSTRCVSLKYSRTRDGLALPFLLSFRLSAFSSPEPFLFLFHFYDVSKLAFPANHYDAYRVLQDAWRSRFNFHCKAVPTTAYTASFSLTHYFQHRNPIFVYHEIDCLGLSFVSAAAAAQIANGVSMVMISAMVSSSNPPATATSGGYGYGAPSIQTATPSSPSNFYDYMPYSSYQSGGYKTLECGYGYSKQSDGSCRPESWVSLNQDFLLYLMINIISSTVGRMKVVTQKRSSSMCRSRTHAFYSNSVLATSTTAITTVTVPVQSPSRQE